MGGKDSRGSVLGLRRRKTQRIVELSLLKVGGSSLTIGHILLTRGDHLYEYV